MVKSRYTPVNVVNDAKDLEMVIRGRPAGFIFGGHSGGKKINFMKLIPQLKKLPYEKVIAFKKEYFQNTFSKNISGFVTKCREFELQGITAKEVDGEIIVGRRESSK